jgi:hemin uptake protein HemP
MPTATAATAAVFNRLRNLPSPFLLAGHGAVQIRANGARRSLG